VGKRVTSPQKASPQADLRLGDEIHGENFVAEGKEAF
jgi:hypothetical protein